MYSPELMLHLATQEPLGRESKRLLQIIIYLAKHWYSVLIVPTRLAVTILPMISLH